MLKVHIWCVCIYLFANPHYQIHSFLTARFLFSAFALTWQDWCQSYAKHWPESDPTLYRLDDLLILYPKENLSAFPNRSVTPRALFFYLAPTPCHTPLSIFHSFFLFFAPSPIGLSSSFLFLFRSRRLSVYHRCSHFSVHLCSFLSLSRSVPLSI